MKSIKPLNLFLFFLLFGIASCAVSTLGDGEVESRGGEFFLFKGCTGCHRVLRPVGPESVTGLLRLKGPDLWFAGSKFKDGFLKRWLQDPVALRPLEFNSLAVKNKGLHVKLSVDEADLVAAYLMGLTAPALAEPVVLPEASLVGRVIFSNRFSCYACHRVRRSGIDEAVTGGLSGPVLTGASTRLRADWIYAFLSRPERFQYKTPMPVYAGLISDEEMRELAAYVAALQ